MNNSFIKPVYFIARFLVAITFLVAGIHKMVAWDKPAMWMASKGLPMVDALLAIATFLELAGAVLLIINFKTKWVSVILAGFMLALTFMMHNFWAMEGMMFQTSFLDFIKNIAIVGGLLAMALFASKMEMPEEALK